MGIQIEFYNGMRGSYQTNEFWNIFKGDVSHDVGNTENRELESLPNSFTDINSWSQEVSCHVGDVSAIIIHNDASIGQIIHNGVR